MAAETVDPVDLPLLPTLYRAVPSERHLHGANASEKSEQSRSRIEPGTNRTRGNHHTHATTQGIILIPFEGIKRIGYVK